MKKILLVFICFVATTLFSAGQKWRYYWWEGELGGGIHIAFNDLNKWMISPAGTVSLRYKFHQYTAAKIQVAAAQVSGTDRRDTVTVFSYTTLFVAPSLRVEYEIFRAKKDLPGYNSRGLDMDLRKYWVYLFAGIGGIYFDPKPADDMPEEKFKKYTWIVPVGAGIKYNFHRALSVGAEVEFTFTGSDYLEGYSPGHSSRNDKFFLIRAEAAYRFGTSPSSSLRIR
jgi:opacity protein-like surface antigen